MIENKNKSTNNDNYFIRIMMFIHITFHIILFIICIFVMINNNKSIRASIEVLTILNQAPQIRDAKISYEKKYREPLVEIADLQRKGIFNETPFINNMAWGNVSEKQYQHSYLNGSISEQACLELNERNKEPKYYYIFCDLKDNIPYFSYF